MLTKWENIIVALIVLLAATYVGRRAWLRIVPFLTKDQDYDQPCGSTGCGGCGSTRK